MKKKFLLNWLDLKNLADYSKRQLKVRLFEAMRRNVRYNKIMREVTAIGD